MRATHIYSSADERWGLEDSASFWIAPCTTQKNWTSYPFLPEWKESARNWKRYIWHVQLSWVWLSSRNIPHACQPMESIYALQRFGVVDLRTWQMWLVSGKVLEVVHNEFSRSCNGDPCSAAYNALCKTCICNASPCEQEFSYFHGWGNCITERLNDFPSSHTKSETDCRNIWFIFLSWTIRWQFLGMKKTGRFFNSRS